MSIWSLGVLNACSDSDEVDIGKQVHSFLKIKNKKDKFVNKNDNDITLISHTL